MSTNYVFAIQTDFGLIACREGFEPKNRDQKDTHVAKKTRQ